MAAENGQHMRFLRGRDTVIGALLCFATLLTGVLTLLLQPNIPTLAHPSVLVFALPLLLLTLLSIRQQPSLITWDAPTLALFALSALPILHGDITSVLVLITIALSALWLRAKWRWFRRGLVWVLFIAGILCAEVNLIAILLNADLAGYQQHVVNVFLLLSVTAAAQLARASLSNWLRFAVYVLYLTAALGLLLSFDWVLIIIYFAMLIAVLTRYINTLYTPRTLVIVVLPMVLLVALLPYATNRANAQPQVIEGNLVDDIPLARITGRVLTAYSNDIIDEDALYERSVTDVALEGKRLAALVMTVPPYTSSQLRFPLDMPLGSDYWLDFSISRLDTVEPFTESVWFRVDVVGNGLVQRTVLEYEHLPNEVLRWRDLILDISEYEGQDVVLILSAWHSGGEPVRIIWGRLRLAHDDTVPLILLAGDVTTGKNESVFFTSSAIDSPFEALRKRIAFLQYMLNNEDVRLLQGSRTLTAFDFPILNDLLLHFFVYAVTGLVAYIAVLIFVGREMLQQTRAYDAVARWLALVMVGYGTLTGVLIAPAFLGIFLVLMLGKQDSPPRE